MSALNLAEASAPPEPRRLGTSKIDFRWRVAHPRPGDCACPLRRAWDSVPGIPILSALLVRFRLTQPKAIQSQGLRESPRAEVVDEARGLAFIFAGDSRSRSTRI